MVTVRLEKHVSKVSKLYYEVSYRSANVAGITRGTGILSSINRNIEVYTTGIFSVDIVNMFPTSRSVAYHTIAIDSQSNGSCQKQARDIFENDKRVAYFLGQSGMPGYVGTSPLTQAQPLHSEINSNSGDLDGSDSMTVDAFVSDSYQYLQNQREQSFHWSRHHAKLLNHLAASADVVEDVCRLNTVVVAHIYLRALILLTNIAGSVRCRDRIFANIKKILPKAFFHSLGFLRWLCIIPTLTSDTQASNLHTSRDDIHSQGIFTYDVLIIHIKQCCSVFLEVLISGLGNLKIEHEKYAGTTSGINSGNFPEVNPHAIVQSIFKSLQSLDFDPVVLRRNLSSVAISPISVACSNSFKSRLGILKSCYLNSICHFTAVNLPNRSLIESLVSDICRSKIAMGFSSNVMHNNGQCSRIVFMCGVAFLPVRHSK